MDTMIQGGKKSSSKVQQMNPVGVNGLPHRLLVTVLRLLLLLRFLLLAIFPALLSHLLLFQDLLLQGADKLRQLIQIFITAKMNIPIEIHLLVGEIVSC